MLIATFSVPPGSLALEETLRAIPAIRLEAEQLATHSTEWVMPSLWVTDGDPDAVEERLRADPTVKEVVDVEQFPEETFYHIDWDASVERRIDAMIDKEGLITHATVRDSEWLLRLRFVTRDQFETFKAHFTAEDRGFELRSLTDSDAPRYDFGEVTANQRDALLLAMEEGYYRIPRETTIGELAETLDISHQAVSELLRRGTENLIDATLAAPTAPNHR